MFDTNKEGKGGRGVSGKEVGGGEGISNTQLKDKTIALLNI